MQLIQRLKAGTAFTDSDGTIRSRAPSSLQLQAARALEELLQVRQGLEHALQTLIQEYHKLEQELHAQRSLVEKLLADAQLQSSGAVPGTSANAEAGRPETVNSAHEGT